MTTPAHKFSMLDNRQATIAILSIAIKRLGGSLTLTQEEFDAVAGSELHEDGSVNPLSVSFVLHMPKEKTQ